MAVFFVCLSFTKEPWVCIWVGMFSYYTITQSSWKVLYRPVKWVLTSGGNSISWGLDRSIETWLCRLCMHGSRNRRGTAPWPILADCDGARVGEWWWHTCRAAWKPTTSWSHCQSIKGASVTGGTRLLSVKDPQLTLLPQNRKPQLWVGRLALLSHLQREPSSCRHLQCLQALKVNKLPVYCGFCLRMTWSDLWIIKTSKDGKSWGRTGEGEEGEWEKKGREGEEKGGERMRGRSGGQERSLF